MQLEEKLIKAGQHFVSGFRGDKLTPEFVECVKKYKIGNFIIFSDNVTSLESLNKLCMDVDHLIFSETGYHPFITIDQEGGMVSRLPMDSIVLPSQMALSALGDEKIIEEASYRNGKLLRALGCNFNLVPCLDVNENKKNPVIGVRSFSDKKEIVSKFGCASIRGYKKSGILFSPKHFPGHGDTNVDSHLSLPVINKSLDELSCGQLVPFLDAVKEGVPAIMTSHILFPQIEREKIPCTMSRTILTSILREQLGFKGIIISDCMEMNAIKNFYGTQDASIRALKAGVDIVFISHHADIACKTIEKVAEQYDAIEEYLETSLSRLGILKEKLSSPQPFVMDSQMHELKKKYDILARESISHVSGKVQIADENMVFVSPKAYITSNISDQLDGADFVSYMLEKFPSCKGEVISADPDEKEIQALVEKLKGTGAITFGSYNGHLQKGQIKTVKALSEAGHKINLFALRNPYDLSPDVSEMVSSSFACYEYSSRIFDEIALLIQNKGSIKGRLPVEV